MSEVEITLREAIPDDVAALLQVNRKLPRRQTFLIMDEVGLGLSEEMLSPQLADLYESENNLLLLAWQMKRSLVWLQSRRRQNSLSRILARLVSVC